MDQQKMSRRESAVAHLILYFPAHLISTAKNMFRVGPKLYSLPFGMALGSLLKQL
jgi:hypothetical protein